MLTITPPSEIFTAVKNPIYWKACSNVATSVPGTKAQVILKIGETGPEDGDYFTFFLGGQSFTFTFRDSPVNCNEIAISGLVLYSQLEAAVNSQRFIEMFYDVSVIDNELKITAKENGQDDSVALFVTSNTDVIYFLSSTPGSNDSNRDFKIIGDISTADGLLGTVSGVPNGGCNTFNLEEYLRSIVKHPAPEIGGSHKLASDVITPYTLTFWEQYDGNICGKVVDATRVAWNGGTLNEYASTFNPTVLFFEYDPFDPIDRRFLTNRPKTSVQNMLNIDWLYWYTTEASVTMHYTITYANGNTQDLTKVVAIASTDEVYAYRCDLEYWKVNVLDQTVDKVVKAEFWLTTASETSERRTFIRADESNPFTRHFAFGNSLGGLDFFTTKNYLQKGTKIDAYTTLDSAHLNSKQLTKFSDQYLLSTGCINQATANWLQEVFVTEPAYIYDGTQWIPIIIEDNEKLLWKDKQGFYEIQFSFKTAYDNKAVDHAQRML